MAKKGEPPLGLLPIHIGIWLHFLGCFVKMDDLASQSWWFITAKQFLWFIKCVIQIIPFLKSDDPALWSEWSRSSTSWRDCSRWSSSWSLMIQHPEAISLLLRFMFAPPLFNDKTCVAPPPEHQIKCYPPSKNVPPILYNIGATSLSILPPFSNCPTPFIFPFDRPYLHCWVNRYTAHIAQNCTSCHSRG